MANFLLGTIFKYDRLNVRVADCYIYDTVSRKYNKRIDC